MAFPGTYNINYYKGDTYEFRIYPKDSNGASFDLTQYGNATFTISNARGSEGVSSKIEALAVITSGNAGNYITCTIRPDDSKTMDPTVSYVYDVEITKIATPYNYVNTLLTGSLTVTDQVGNSSIPSVTHKVTYLSDIATTYGTYPIDSNKYIAGQAVTIKSASSIKNPGNVFIGWTTNENGTGTKYANPADGISGAQSTIAMGNSDIVLFAQWS
jgi:hypothetical protein